MKGSSFTGLTIRERAENVKINSGLAWNEHGNSGEKFGYFLFFDFYVLMTFQTKLRRIKCTYCLILDHLETTYFEIKFKF